MSLKTKTVLVSLNFSFWSAQKFDKKASKEVNERNGAAEDAGRFNKHMLHKDALKEIQQIMGQARRFHNTNTLDWDEAQGTRILPAKKIPAYTDYMRKKRQEFTAACEVFFQHYPQYVSYSANRLGSLFNIEDFPPIEEVRNRYSFNTSISPVPTSGDFRVDIPNNQLNEIQQDMDSRMKKAESTATKDLWNRTHKVLSTLHEALSNPNGKLYATTTHENIVDLLDQIKDLNFTDDPELTETARLIESSLTKLDKTAIKNDDLIRQQALDQTDAIMRKMTGVMGYAA